MNIHNNDHYETMYHMNSNQSSRRIDIVNLQNEVRTDILNDKPPPRPIIGGKINLKHFIYQIEILNRKINELQQMESLDVCRRKLNNRNLQVNELRKRIQKLKFENLEMSKLKQKIKNLSTEKEELKRQLNVVNDENKLYKQKHIQNESKITDLNEIISKLEDRLTSEAEDYISESESETLKERIDKIESTSPSLTPNTQDNDFIVVDDVDMGNDSDSFEMCSTDTDTGKSESDEYSSSSDDIL